MKNVISLLIILILVNTFSSCVKKPLVTCGYIRNPSIDSRVLSLKSLGIADTTIAAISGLITGVDSLGGIETIDTLSFASIGFINKINADTLGLMTGQDGKFQFTFKAGAYDIFASYSGYNRLMVENVKFRTGETKELIILLGSGGFSTTTDNGQNFNKTER